VSSPDPRYDAMEPVLPGDMEPLVDVTVRPAAYLDVIRQAVEATQHQPSLQASLLTILNTYHTGE